MLTQNAFRDNKNLKTTFALNNFSMFELEY